MALVWARVYGNAVGTLVYTDLGELHHIRVITFSRIAYQGDFIEVNTEICHVCWASINRHLESS